MSQEKAFLDLESFYSDLIPDSVDPKMLCRIRADREDSRQKVSGAVAGFGLGGVIALTALLLAARPSQSAEAGTMASIARLQMIHSGLVLRAEGTIEAPH